MDVLSSICASILASMFLIPTLLYGAMIGNRIVNNEAGGKWYKKIVVIPLCAALGILLLPVTFILVMVQWDDLFEEICHTISKLGF